MQRFVIDVKQRCVLQLILAEESDRNRRIFIHLNREFTFESSATAGEDRELYVGAKVALIIENEILLGFGIQLYVAEGDIMFFICDWCDESDAVSCGAHVGDTNILRENLIPALEIRID